MLSKNCLITLFILLGLTGSGCDPAIHFVPEGWEKAGTRSFQKSFGSIEIEMTRAGGLIGESWFDPNFTVKNAGSEVLVLQKIYLVAGAKQYDSVTDKKEELTLKPNEVHELSTEWKFTGEDNSLWKVFRKPPADIHIEVLVGNETKEIVITLKQENP